MNIQSLPVLLAAGDVQRYHTMPALHRQNVASHTWRVMLLIHWLYFPDQPPAALTYSALMHDVPEVYTGDFPAYVKWADEGIARGLERLEDKFCKDHGIEEPNVTSLENNLLKFCDIAELTMYALEEMDMGNNHMRSVVRNGYVHMKKRGANELLPQAVHFRVQAMLKGVTRRMQNITTGSEGW